MEETPCNRHQVGFLDGMGGGGAHCVVERGQSGPSAQTSACERAHHNKSSCLACNISSCPVQIVHPLVRSTHTQRALRTLSGARVR